MSPNGVFAVVRHADAGDKHAWSGPDRDRPLSPLGQQQAAGLATSMSWLRQPTLVSSPFVRCRQTLQPMALQNHVEILTDARLGLQAGGAGLDPRDALFENAVLCTHGEVIRALFRSWLKRDLVKLPLSRGDVRKNSAAKGGVWIFSQQPEGLVGQYRAPVVSGSVLGGVEV